MLIKKAVIASLLCLVAPLGTANDLNSDTPDRCDGDGSIKGSFGTAFEDQSDEDVEKYSVSAEWDPFPGLWSIGGENGKACLKAIVELKGSVKRSFQLGTRKTTDRIDFYPLELAIPFNKDPDPIELTFGTGIGYEKVKSSSPMTPDDREENFTSLYRIGLEFPVVGSWSIKLSEVWRFDRLLSGRDSAQSNIELSYKFSPKDK